MARTRVHRAAAVGAAEHGNSVVLVTVTPEGELLDRRRIDLTRDLPTHPYHHEGSWAVGGYLNSPWARTISLVDAVALVERVHIAAVRGARESLEELAAATRPVPIASIAIRMCPELPPTIEERIVDIRSANISDSIMYCIVNAGLKLPENQRFEIAMAVQPAWSFECPRCSSPAELHRRSLGGKRRPGGSPLSRPQPPEAVAEGQSLQGTVTRPRSVTEGDDRVFMWRQV